MKKRLTALLATAALCAGVLSSADALAQGYPSRPVKFLIGFAAGGPTDVIARIVAQDMTVSLGQSVIVENRPGANAIIATELVARAAPDGYTLLFSSLSLLVNAILMENKVKYDPFRDFTPISNAAALPMVVVTSPETRLGSMKDLVALAKAKPGEVSYATSGSGGSTHLAGAMLENATGTKMINVPFKGNGPALAEVMSGRVTFMFYPIVGIADQVAGKKLRVLAVGTPKPTFPRCRRWRTPVSRASSRLHLGSACSLPPGPPRRSSSAWARRCASPLPGPRPRSGSRRWARSPSATRRLNLPPS